MNMIMHGDGHGGIFHTHGLDVGFTNTTPLTLGCEVTCIFSNPPFAGREEDPQQLQKFKSTKSESDRFVKTHKTIPFVEHIINVLADEGRAALVLPSGIFSSQSHQFRKLRDLIWEHTEIVAIIGLPHWVFFHTGCDVQGALLFLKKKSSPRKDYNVFIDWAEHVGYDAAGRKTGKNDFPEILERFATRPKANLFRASQLRSRGRIDPLYYQPGEHQKAGTVKGKNLPLTQVLIESREHVKRSPDNASKVRYVEVGDTNMVTGKIDRTTEYEINSLPSRAKYIARENMLLIPNHRNSIKAGRSVVLVPAEHDGVIVTSRFIVVRTTVPAAYLYQVLNLDFVKEKMLRLVSGSSSTEVKFEQLAEILVPMPDGEDFDLFLERLETAQSEVDAARVALASCEQSLSDMMRTLYDQ